MDHSGQSKSFRAVILTLAAFFALSVSFVAGAYLGFENRPAIDEVTVLANKEAGRPEAVDFSPFWQAWVLIDEKYVPASGLPNPASTTDQTKVWGAISGLVGSLADPYSSFLSPDENRLFEEELNGQFGGVGMELEWRDEQLTIVAPLAGTPAYRAGLLPDDRIIEIDGRATNRLNLTEAIKMIRGAVGDPVRLKIFRPRRGEFLDFVLVREIIRVPTLETKLLEEDVFFIKLYNFGASSPELFRQALKDFSAAKTDKLILDVRGNPGGLLGAAVEIASWFLPAGKPVIQEVKRDVGRPEIYRSRGYNVVSPGLRLVILIDGGSASAAEILAGALAEHKVATLIGEKTFGKGSVQELIPLAGDTSLKLTVARWLTPQGFSLSESGLTPHLVVTVSEADRIAKRDPQLEAAIEFLTK